MSFKINLTNTDNQVKQIQEAVKIIKDLEAITLNKNEILDLDFSNVGWMLPCSILLLSNKIVDLARKINIKIIPPNNNKLKNYLLKVGFPLGEVKTGYSYLPITHFTDQDNVNKEISNIINHFQKNISPNFGQSVIYLLGELSDNIDQHSRFTSASIMAQYYKNKGHIDLGIFDDGITIPSLFEEKGISFKDDCEAIHEAMHGKSTKKDTTRGFGLSTSKRLVLEGLKGKMYVFSRKGAISLGPPNREKELKLQKNSLKGTLIYMRFEKPEKPLNIYKYVE